MSKTHTTELTRLRASVRTILLTEGTALSPRANTPEGIDDLIGQVADHGSPSLDRESQTLVQRVEDATGRGLAVEISDHLGALMAAYGDSGYHVGLAAGLELAALIVGQSTIAPEPRARRGRKAGAR
jgi:hypothetical protein